MKRSVRCIIFTVLVLLLSAAVAMSVQPGTRSASGKVIGVGEDGKGISISSMAGGQELVVGAIVTEATQVHVKGKKADIQDIKQGDTVTLTYSYEKDNLYAKKVVKK